MTLSTENVQKEYRRTIDYCIVYNIKQKELEGFVDADWQMIP
jgi:hypothetical protein